MPALSLTENLYYIAGQTVRLTLNVVGADGLPANLTGSAIRFALMDLDTGDPVVSTEFDTPTVTLEPIDLTIGQLNAVIEPDNTMNLLGSYRYVGQVEDVSDDKSPIADGLMSFDPAQQFEVTT